MSGALGFRVKSGCATVVLLTGPASAVRLVDRRQIDLSDPSVPESRQPYHAGFGSAREEAKTIARLVRRVERYAVLSIAEAVRHYRGLGYAIDRAGAVVGSRIDPGTIANPHIRAHASEGQLFRRVTEDALAGLGVGCSIWVERTLYEAAARRLGHPEERIRKFVAGLGRGVSGGWRAEDKTAALAAWLAACDRESAGTGGTSPVAARRSPVTTRD
jgi:hypothetical protein